MCFTLVINRGEYEIQTPRQFNDFFGKKLIKVDNEILEDCCLCGIPFNIEWYLNLRKIKFENIDGDIYAEMTKEQLKRIGK